MICTRLHSGLHLSCQCVFVRESLTLSTVVRRVVDSCSPYIYIYDQIETVRSQVPPGT